MDSDRDIQGRDMDWLRVEWDGMTARLWHRDSIEIAQWWPSGRRQFRYSDSKIGSDPQRIQQRVDGAMMLGQAGTIQ